MPAFLNTILAVSGLLVTVMAFPANMTPNPADRMNPRALGINCRGSGLCPLASIENHSGVSIIQLWHDVLAATDKDDSTVYNSGDHIVCIGTSVSISIGASVSAEADGISGDINLSTDIQLGSGGVCLFLQGASLTLGQIKPLVDALGQHGCTTCGSVPIHFVDEGSNDPAPGILTSNYVGNPFCKSPIDHDMDTVRFTNSSQAAATASAASASPKWHLVRKTHHLAFWKGGTALEFIAYRGWELSIFRHF